MVATGHGNYVNNDIPGVFISYNPKIHSNAFDDFLVLCGEAEDRSGKDETAIKVDDVWMILNGDFTKDYLACESKEECINFYKNKKEEYRSDFSTD